LKTGLLFVVSAPSGTGKTTLIEQLVKRVPDLVMSRSYTSRPRRPGETDGADYNFVSKDRFEQMIGAGEFLEWVNIFGHLYGTSAVDIERHRLTGRDVFLVIDVKGARQIRQREIALIGIFVLPPSFKVLEDRLRRRSGDYETEVQLRRRLDTAREEVAASCDYDYIVVNDSIDTCVDRISSITVAERARARAMGTISEAIAETFRRA
tara:strand:+ start:131 stop:754 length:624 start_codon:yes stop_codon:yes gene_type:complete